jgi:hypothetical protein
MTSRPGPVGPSRTGQIGPDRPDQDEPAGRAGPGSGSRFRLGAPAPGGRGTGGCDSERARALPCVLRNVGWGAQHLFRSLCTAGRGPPGVE